MPPQVASLSELSRIRGDAGVRYPYAITQARAFCSSGLAGAKRQRRTGGEVGFGGEEVLVGVGAMERERGGGRYKTGRSKVMNCL